MDQTAKPGAEPSPEIVTQLSMGYMPSRCLAAAVQLDLFSPLDTGARTAEETARAAQTNPRATRMLMDALTALGLLRKEDGRYDLSAAARRYLLRSSPDYLGAMLESDDLWKAWVGLADSVRTGRPYHRVEQEEKAEDFFPRLVRSLHIMNREPARRAAEALLAERPARALRVLDVACGSGVWGLAVAGADAQAKVCFQDYPGVLELTRQYARRHGLLDRSEFLAGNLREADWGDGRFDLALLGNIVHSEGEAASRVLFGRLHRALAPGGRIAVVDMIPAEDRSGPPLAVLFALNMLVNTELGDTYTLGEYTAWLEEAGFSEVRTADIGSHSPLILATR